MCVVAGHIVYLCSRRVKGWYAACFGDVFGRVQAEQMLLAHTIPEVLVQFRAPVNLGNQEKLVGNQAWVKLLKNTRAFIYKIIITCNKDFE